MHVAAQRFNSIEQNAKAIIEEYFIRVIIEFYGVHGGMRQRVDESPTGIIKLFEFFLSVVRASKILHDKHINIFHSNIAYTRFGENRLLHKVYLSYISGSWKI